MLILEIAAGIILGGIGLFILYFVATVVLEAHNGIPTPVGCFIVLFILALFVGVGFLAAKFLFCSDCVLHVTL
jgi:hypothetical protein